MRVKVNKEVVTDGYLNPCSYRYTATITLDVRGTTMTITAEDQLEHLALEKFLKYTSRFKFNTIKICECIQNYCVKQQKE